MAPFSNIEIINLPVSKSEFNTKTGIHFYSSDAAYFLGSSQAGFTDTTGSSDEVYNLDIDNNSLVFKRKISGSHDNVDLFHLTSSGTNPRLGIGFKSLDKIIKPFEIRTATGSEPASIVLRTNEDGIVQLGEETGRIIFARESASFHPELDEFIVSGSTAEIFSRVTGINGGTPFGSLVFQTNTDAGTVNQEVMEIGPGKGSTQASAPGVGISGSLKIIDSFPIFELQESSGNTIPVEIRTKPTDNDQGIIKIREAGNTNVSIGDDSAGGYHLISGSGMLFASLSLDNSNFKTVMYDTSSGKLFFTGSYGGGGQTSGISQFETISIDNNGDLVADSGNSLPGGNVDLVFVGGPGITTDLSSSVSGDGDFTQLIIISSSGVAGGADNDWGQGGVQLGQIEPNDPPAGGALHQGDDSGFVRGSITSSQQVIVKNNSLVALSQSICETWGLNSSHKNSLVGFQGANLTTTPGVDTYNMPGFAAKQVNTYVTAVHQEGQGPNNRIFPVCLTGKLGNPQFPGGSSQGGFGLNDGYPYNNLRFHQGFFYEPLNGGGGGGGNGGDGGPDHPGGDSGNPGTPDDDFPGGIWHVQGGIRATLGRNDLTQGSSSFDISTGSGQAPPAVEIRPQAGILFFETGSTLSPSGSYRLASASAILSFETSSKSVQLFVGSKESSDLTRVMFISHSGNNPRVGFGINKPIRAFDFKEVRDDDRGGELLIRGSRTTRGADVGDEVGRINFAIDSASFGKVDISGSAAEIVSIVEDVDATGIQGSLSLRVSDRKSFAPGEILKIKSTGIETTGRIDATSVISGSTLRASGDANIGDWLYAGAISIGNPVDPGPNNLQVNGNINVVGNSTLGNGLSDTVTIAGNITASSNISASGTIVGSNLSGTNTGDQDLSSYIQASQTSSFLTEISSGIISSSAQFGSSDNVTFGTIEATSLNVTSITSSIVTSSILFTEGSNVFGDTTADNHTFTGSLLVTGSSHRILGNSIRIGERGQTAVDFSQNNNRNILKLGDALVSDNETYIEINDDTQIITFSAQSIKLGNQVIPNITASGNISSSGTITANSIVGTLSTAAQTNITSVGTLTGLNINGNITASGNISASGEIKTTHVIFPQGGNTSAGGVSFGPPGTDVGYIYDDTNRLTLGYNDSDIISLGLISGESILMSGNTRLVGNLTSSGNISSSQNLIANNLTLSGDLTATNATAQLLNITASGNISSSGTITANSLVGSHTLTTAAQPNVTSLGTLTALTVDQINLDGNSISSTVDSNVDINLSNQGISFSAYAGDLFKFNVNNQDEIDFQVAGGSDQNAIFVKSNNDNVGIGTNTPTKKLTVAGDISSSGQLLGAEAGPTINTTLVSDSATNIDTFNTSSNNGAIYDYTLFSAPSGARAGQCMVIHHNGNTDFTDTSTPTLGSETSIPFFETAVNGANVEVKIASGSSYTFKAFVKKL